MATEDRSSVSEQISPEIQQAANEISYNAGKWVREKLLAAGFSDEEIKKTMREVMQGIYINGVPVRERDE